MTETEQVLAILALFGFLLILIGAAVLGEQMENLRDLREENEVLRRHVQAQARAVNPGIVIIPENLRWTVGEDGTVSNADTLEASLLTAMTPVKHEEAREAAAFHGIAENEAFPVADRLKCALQALAYYAPEEG